MDTEIPTAASSLPGMALSSRAHAFSVEALMGRPSKRKAQDPREEMQPELQEEQFVEEGEEILRSPSRDSQQPDVCFLLFGSR
uniref:T-box 22 n=1 Tax=Mus musculus TaxID=10090 RepID=G3UXA1_MOUSE